ncbi:MAG: helix-turn-helix domain-containing protein [Acidobacteria bacterium]|nr:helix-turn-helix domain-containing protein [Acidobacteriota bacterium]
MAATLLGATGAGEILKVSASRVTQLNREGALPAVRDSAGRRLYTREDVEALARSRAGRVARESDPAATEQ